MSCCFFIVILFIISETKNKTKKNTKIVKDLLMFYSVNQRCYLTLKSSIRNFYHFDDTKDNQRFFSLHGLNEWC